MLSYQKKLFLAVPMLLGISGLVYSKDKKHSTKDKKPNILFILADDLGWKDLSCMGSKYYESPNIDSLANRGTRFTNAYAACQVSSPSRASILTGQYTVDHGITDWIGDPYGEDWQKMNRHTKLLPPKYRFSLDSTQYTLAQCLKDNGYTTFIAGKWHLGDKGSLPEDKGFMINKGGWKAGSPMGGYFTPFKNPALPDKEPGENLSMRLAKETASFLDSQKKSKKPFFAYLSFYAVHCPIQCTHEKWKYFRDKAEKMGIAKEGFEFDKNKPVRVVQDNPIYAGLISQMDDAIGLVLNELKKTGLDKNTIVIFTSDNGGVVFGDDNSTSILPLRGGKGHQWEGGIRVPLIMALPKSMNINQVDSCSTSVCGIDFYPTLLNLVNVKLPSKQKIDGVNIEPLLEGKTIAQRPLFWHYPHYGNQRGEPSAIIREGDWKLIHYYEDGRDELYNTKIDVTESQTLNAHYPEKVKELKAKLMDWLSSHNANMPYPDPKYSPQAETALTRYWRTIGKDNLEKQRLHILSKDFVPDSTWWGSEVKKK